MHATVLKIRTVLRHPLAMGSVLAGSAVAFTAAPGSLGDFMTAAGVLFALNVVFGTYRLRELTAGHIAALVVLCALVLISVSLPGARLHERSLRYLLLTPGMIMACHALARQLEGVRGETMTAATTAVVCICVTVQLIGVRVHHPPGAFYGFYENQHHLGLFVSLALPVLGYVMLRSGGWRRAIPVPFVVAALYLLWVSDSRVSWLVFFTVIPMASLLVLKRSQFFGVVIGTSALVVASAWLSGFSAIGRRIAELYANFWFEERILYIWPVTLHHLSQNTLREWVFGRGIGSFRLGHVELTSPFPHNAVLQLLFENGIVGMLLVLGAFASLMWAMWRLARRLADPGGRHLAATLLALLWIETGHCLLTKSVYSKYTLFSLSLVIGVSLVVIEKARGGFYTPLLAKGFGPKAALSGVKSAAEGQRHGQNRAATGVRENK